ncbi:beta-L-arabinofuranosidase domain-containing protein [Flammeovirga sp. EKP202]|uniref:beta-L-arabinofuranosidase domain-containing protein n=1 Tax=Flammeovirga sp. EKP202 TaxID=2770592 RepID=UPI00165FF808|nr:beta-L-arabinofuranosidase domain-containing protein [Flammeovirga sp. EKP202]MBD0402397.1 glycoside hydrolase family 127 protein [Flammeovirga sp. EKP202]
MKKANSPIKAVQFGDIQPEGWIKEQMKYDLKEGFVGHLDELVPDLIIEDDIYGKDRLTKKVKSKDVGAVNSEGEWNVQFLWWNSETQSNWWDGYIRNALLTGDKEAIAKVVKYVNEKLATQDPDGYIGVYADDLRYDHTTENGELWAQASLFRGLLAYYEATDDQKVLEAVVKAVEVTMEAYPIEQSTPFKTVKPFAGVGHGLTFTDVCDQLYDITGEQKYLDFAKFLLDDYNLHQMAEEDILLKNLADKNYKFKGHGVHTYEHLRSLTLAAYTSGDPKYKEGLQHYLEKLKDVVSVSGGPIGDEWIFGRHADADSTGYEYCSLQELLDSYAVLNKFDHNSAWGDKIEWLLFNAAQGARHPHHSSIAYCKSDNSYSMCGHINDHECKESKENRFKYSPVHKDIAVCCAPNAGRIYPYFIQNMWQTDGNTLYLDLYGPSNFTSIVNGKKVKVQQVTNYPASNQVELKVAGNTAFDLALRVPQWAEKFEINGKEFSANNKGYVIVPSDVDKSSITIKMGFSPEIHQESQGEYVSYGPLLFALPLEGTAEDVKVWKGDFKDQKYAYTQDEKSTYTLETNSLIKVHHLKGNNPFESVALEVDFKNTKGEKVTSTMKPLGATVLRKSVF